MYSMQLADQQSFLNKAQEWNAQIRVVRTPTVVPVVEQGAVLMTPAVVLQYTAVSPFPLDDARGGIAVVFKETILQGPEGSVDLRGSLWARLTGDQPPPNVGEVVLVHRTGSL